MIVTNYKKYRKKEGLTKKQKERVANDIIEGICANPIGALLLQKTNVLSEFRKSQKADQVKFTTKHQNRTKERNLKMKQGTRS